MGERFIGVEAIRFQKILKEETESIWSEVDILEWIKGIFILSSLDSSKGLLLLLATRKGAPAEINEGQRSTDAGGSRKITSDKC